MEATLGRTLEAIQNSTTISNNSNESYEQFDSSIPPHNNSRILSIHILNDDILDLLKFLDFISIKKLRLVCARWSILALPHINRRGYYSIPCEHRYDDYRPPPQWKLNLKEATSKYSSLKFHLLLAIHPAKLNEPEIWRNVKTLHLSVPLTRDSIVSIRKLIATLCSFQLSELTLHFDESGRSSEVESVYKLAVQGGPSMSFPKLAEYPHIKSLTFQGVDRSSTAYFASHLINSFCNLQALSFEDATHSYRSGSYSFSLLEHLMKVNDFVFRKLETFGFTIERSDESVDPESRCQPSYSAMDTEFIRSLQHLTIPFEKHLKSLVWDVPFAKINSQTYELLPGILSNSVASSLVKLQLNTAVFDLNGNTSSYDEPKLIPISFPKLENLREFIIGNRTCYTLSLSDLLNKLRIFISW
jgi:hypothetical protein